MFSGLCLPSFDGYACVKSRIRVQNCSKSKRHGTVTRLRGQMFRGGTSFTRAETTSRRSARVKIRAPVPYFFLATMCRKLGMPCQKVAGTVPKFWGAAVPIFQRVQMGLKPSLNPRKRGHYHISVNHKCEPCLMEIEDVRNTEEPRYNDVSTRDW